jgi:adenosylmethionine-8-amino-7-oxononanoate aminotransferase
MPNDNTFYHGHTFTGNPIACAAAIEVFKIYEEEEILAQARRKGKIMAKLMSRFRAIKGVRNVRGLGMIFAFELDNAAHAAAIRKKMLEAGVLIRPLGNTIYLMPPLNTPENLLEQTIGLLKATMIAIM